MLAFHRILLPMTLALLVIGATSATHAVDYLAVGSNDGVAIYDPGTGSPIDTSSMSGFTGDWVVFGPDSKLYVSSYQDAVDTRPWDIAAYPVGTWTPQEAFAEIYTSEPPTVTHRAVGMEYGPNGYLYVADVNGRLFRTNTPGAIPEIVAGGLGGDNRGMCISPDGILYVTAQGAQKIYRFNIITSALPGPWPMRQIGGTGVYPNSVTIGPDANSDGASDLYVTYWALAADQSVIDIYSGTDGAFIGVFDNLANYGHGGSVCYAVVFSQDGSTAYFSDWTDGIVYKKVGSAPATEFITGINRPKSVSLSNKYNPTGTSISGSVAIPGYAGDISNVGVVAELWKNGSRVRGDKFFLGTNGSFTMSGISEGTYDLYITQSHSLGTVISGISLHGTPYDAGTINLIGGDVDGSKSIGIGDVSAVSSSYGQSGQ